MNSCLRMSSLSYKINLNCVKSIKALGSDSSLVVEHTVSGRDAHFLKLEPGIRRVVRSGSPT